MVSYSYNIKTEHLTQMPLNLEGNVTGNVTGNADDSYSSNGIGSTETRAIIKFNGRR